MTAVAQASTVRAVDPKGSTTSVATRKAAAMTGSASPTQRSKRAMGTRLNHAIEISALSCCAGPC